MAASAVAARPLPARVAPTPRTRHLAAAVLAALLLVVAAYLAATAYLATQVTQAVREPVRGTPAAVSLAYEPVELRSATDGVPIRGWLLPARGERAVILLHGLDHNRWDSDWHAELAPTLVRAGFDVLVFDLRAHGESGGDHVGLGWLERGDVRAGVDLLLARGIPPGRIGLHGTSYGASTALLAAAAIPEVGAVLADSGFADARDLLDQEIRRKTGLPPVFTPGITYFASAFYGLDLARIPPVLAVPALGQRPVLFVHGTADSRIPVDHALRLKAAASPAGELWLVEGAEHVGARGARMAEYEQRMLRLFDAALR